LVFILYSRGWRHLSLKTRFRLIQVPLYVSFTVHYIIKNVNFNGDLGRRVVKYRSQYSDVFMNMFSRKNYFQNKFYTSVIQFKYETKAINTTRSLAVSHLVPSRWLSVLPFGVYTVLIKASLPVILRLCAFP